MRARTFVETTHEHESVSSWQTSPLVRLLRLLCVLCLTPVEIERATTGFGCGPVLKPCAIEILILISS
jgi:hypothetical protein